VKQYLVKANLGLPRPRVARARGGRPLLRRSRVACGCPRPTLGPSGWERQTLRGTEQRRAPTISGDSPTMFIYISVTHSHWRADELVGKARRWSPSLELELVPSFAPPSWCSPAHSPPFAPSTLLPPSLPPPLLAPPRSPPSHHHSRCRRPRRRLQCQCLRRHRPRRRRLFYHCHCPRCLRPRPRLRCMSTCAMSSCHRACLFVCVSSLFLSAQSAVSSFLLSVRSHTYIAAALPLLVQACCGCFTHTPNLFYFVFRCPITPSVTVASLSVFLFTALLAGCWVLTFASSCLEQLAARSLILVSPRLVLVQTPALRRIHRRLRRRRLRRRRRRRRLRRRRCLRPPTPSAIGAAAVAAALNAAALPPPRRRRRRSHNATALAATDNIYIYKCNI